MPVPIRRPVARRQRPEDAQQEQGIAFIKQLGGKFYRLGVRRKRGDYQGTMQSEGLPDVLAFIPVRGEDRRIFLAWEAKAPKGRLRPEQQEFRALCQSANVEHVGGDLNALYAWAVEKNLIKREQLPAWRQP